MRTKTVIILSLILILTIIGCNQKTDNKKSNDLTGTIWTSIVVQDICLDSLKFHTKNKVSYYACEVGWTYNAIYSIHGDSVKIGINTTQLDIDKYDQHQQSSKYVLRIKENELEWLKIEHYYAGKFEEVGQEIYDNLENFKKGIKTNANKGYNPLLNP